MSDTPPSHRHTALACLGIVLGMAGLAYASVPLYDLFCKVTGFGGTPVVRTMPAGEVVDRPIAVRFDSNVAPGLPFRFVPEANEVTLKLGETATVFYKITNAGSRPATGVATFNVQPDLAGAYFAKLECFCFTDQTLMPGESRDLAVVFYVDPALAGDANLKDLKNLTLSYTYFPSKGGKPVAEAATPAPKAPTP